MAENRKIAWSTKAAPYVTTALAMEIVALFGFAYMTDSHLPGISPLAATSIFIDGTKDILPTDDSQAADRMKDALSGKYNQDLDADPNSKNKYVTYSRDFGILTGGVGYDESRAEATTNTLAAIQQARADNPCTMADCSDSPIYVVGYSQGANASSDVLAQIAANNEDSRARRPGLHRHPGPYVRHVGQRRPQ